MAFRREQLLLALEDALFRLRLRQLGVDTSPPVDQAPPRRSYDYGRPDEAAAEAHSGRNTSTTTS